MVKQELKKDIRKIIKGKTLIVGIGNPLRGDDAAGLELAEKLKTPSLVTSDTMTFKPNRKFKKEYDKLFKQDIFY